MSVVVRVIGQFFGGGVPNWGLSEIGAERFRSIAKYSWQESGIRLTRPVRRPYRQQLPRLDHFCQTNRS